MMDASVSKTEFRNAMARVCAPVNVITTNGPAGRGVSFANGLVGR